MANIENARITTSLTTGRRVVDMSKEISLLDPNIAPFITIIKNVKGGGGTRVAISPKIEWMEDDYLITKATMDGAISSGSTTTVNVHTGEGKYFRVHDVIHFPSVSENMLVTVVTGDALTVTRGYGTTSAVTTIADDAEIVIIGNASAENSNSRSRLSTLETAQFNYTQIFRTPFELSNTLAASELYGGDDVAYQRRKILAEHKRDIARSMYFGQRKEDTGSGVRRTMQGIIPYIKAGTGTTQAFASNGTTFTYKNFVNNVALPAFKHGSEEKLMLVGGTTAAAIDGWDVEDLITDIKGDTYGVHVKKLVTSYGILNVVYDPLLDGGYTGYGLVLDMDAIKYVYLKGRDTKLLTNIQANDQDGVIDEYITECSLELRTPNRHFVFTGAYIA